MSSPTLSPALTDTSQLSNQDFDRVRKLIHEKAGIQLNDTKRMLVYGRLTPQIRKLGLSGFEEYLRKVQQDERLMQDFVNALTTNLTSFYREAHHFEMLAGWLRDWKDPKVRIWCAAASTGEEPYSIALCCRESVRRGVAVEIVASDIDTKVLDTARAGLYAESQLSNLAPVLRKRWFKEESSSGRPMMRVSDDLKSLVRFRQLNLVKDNWGLGGGFDFAFCRNVLIYFNRDTKTSVIRRMHGELKPGGHLFVGHSEHFRDNVELFQPVGRTAYLRKNS